VIKGWLGNDTSGAPPKPAGAVEHILNWTEQGTTITAQTAHGQATPRWLFGNSRPKAAI
jgi:hypothetical protein